MASLVIRAGAQRRSHTAPSGSRRQGAGSPLRGQAPLSTEMLEPVSSQDDVSADLAEPWSTPEQLPPRLTPDEGEPFPLSCLPVSLQEALSEVAGWSRIPPVIAAVAGITVLATAIGKRAVVVEREGLVHHPALFLVGIADSDERIRAAFRVMTQPLQDWAIEQTTDWTLAVADAQTCNAQLDREIAKAKRGQADLQEAARQLRRFMAERRPIPARPKLFCTDSTEEQLFDFMHERQGAFAVISSEGRRIWNALLRGDSIYQAGISGKSIDRSQTGRYGEPVEREIRRPCLNLCILVPPGEFLTVAADPELIVSAALARIWPAWLPLLGGHPDEQVSESGLDVLKLAEYSALVSDLLAHSPIQREGEHGVPHQARLGSKAADARVDLNNALQDRMAESGDLADVRDLGARAVSQICKVALVLHLARHPEALHEPESFIDEHSWAAAQTIGLWFFDEAVRVRRAAAEELVLQMARRTLDWLDCQSEPLISRRMLSLYGPRPRPNAAMAAKVLALLESFGWLQAVPVPGRHQHSYRVHPMVRAGQTQ